MKRRDFLIKSAIGGIGLSLIPSIAFSNDQFTLLEIGEVNYHNRHGNLFASKSFKVINSFIESINRDVFFKNGHSISNEDAYKVSINGEVIFITPTSKNQVFNIEGRKVVYVESKSINLFEGDVLIPITENTNAINILKATKRVIKLPHILIKKV